MAAKIAHVSWLKRHEPRGKINFGGVEKFAFFLQRAIPELEIFAFPDFPELSIKKMPDWEKAERLNKYLLGNKLIDENSIVISDGFWCAGLSGKVARNISVCHGSYWGTVLSHECYPWGEPQLGEWALKQEEYWREDGVEVVAVSKRAAFELDMCCNIEAYVIEHGLPLDIYKPRLEQGSDGAILHVATSPRKGNIMVAQVQERIQWPIMQLGFAEDGELQSEADLWSQGGVLFQPALYEGSSYALLEALACGLIPVCYHTGYACDLPCDVAEVTDDYHVNNFVEMLERVMASRTIYFPRAYAEEHIRFELFEKNWKRYLGIEGT